MSINVELVGHVPYSLAPADEFQVTFDISTWLGTDEISSVAYSAVDEFGDDNTDCFDPAKCANTTTLIKPYIKGGGTDNKHFTLKCKVTTVNTYVKSFFIKFDVLDPGSR